MKIGPQARITELEKAVGKKVHLKIEEIKVPEIDARLIAESIAQQLERAILRLPGEVVGPVVDAMAEHLAGARDEEVTGSLPDIRCPAMYTVLYTLARTT